MDAAAVASRYASEDYRARFEQHGITCSMSRRGNCYDNAVIESWVSTVKSEERERFESYAHAKKALFDYIEVFYNQRRRHSTFGQISPAEFERRTAASLAVGRSPAATSARRWLASPPPSASRFSNDQCGI